MAKCQNPSCSNEVVPSKTGKTKIYCCQKCRNNMRAYNGTNIRRRVSRDATHPCKRCGGPAPYRKVYCDNCKATPKGAGIRPLTTPRIRNARRREQELIDLVVAKSIAQGRQGGIGEQYHRRFGGIHGVKIG